MRSASVRRLALSLLLSQEEDDRYLNLMLSAPAVKNLAPDDRHFLTALLYGTVERRLTLDYFIGKLSDRRAADLSPHTRTALRLGLYQLIFMQGVPAYAAVNETVALGTSRGEKSLLNAVLRRAQKDGAPALPPREKSPARYLSLSYSFPVPLVRAFLSQYGEEMTEDILRAYNLPPALTLRVHTAHVSREDFLCRLQDAGYAARPTPFSPVGVRLDGSADPTALPGFAEGDFFVQDEASQIAVAALDARGAALTVDACACPGGKSFGAAMDMEGRGRVVSMDVHESKLPLVQEGAARLGLSNIETRVHNGEEPAADLLGRADRVLCDAPCSGWGVLGKKPDMRYRAAARSDLPALQAKLLSAASAYVRPGGLLVYATCTLNEAENGGVCSEFQKNHPEFSPADFQCGSIRSYGGRLHLLPPVHHTDGFFIARFRRSST